MSGNSVTPREYTLGKLRAATGRDFSKVPDKELQLIAEVLLPRDEGKPLPLNTVADEINPYHWLIEQLAEIEHQRWAGWQRYLHSKFVTRTDGNMKYRTVLPVTLVARWERQIATPYSELSEQEKQSDRDEVMRYWPIIEKLVDDYEKAYGGCHNCYGKGYATVNDRWFGRDTDQDIGSPGGTVSGGDDNAMKFCICSRGVQLKKQIDKIRGQYAK